MKYSDEEIRAFIWLQQQCYKVGLLTPAQVTRFEGIDGWTWDGSGEPAPAMETRQRIMRQSSNSYLPLHKLTPA